MPQKAPPKKKGFVQRVKDELNEDSRHVNAGFAAAFKGLAKAPGRLSAWARNEKYEDPDAPAPRTAARRSNQPSAERVRFRTDSAAETRRLTPAMRLPPRKKTD